jgi:hypothetical protein
VLRSWFRVQGLWELPLPEPPPAGVKGRGGVARVRYRRGGVVGEAEKQLKV